MPWLFVVVAGLLEICWAVGLKYTGGFTRPFPSILIVMAICASLYLMSLAARTLPISTIYAVWVGIGAGGVAAVGILALDEPASPARVFFLCLLIASIVGLRATSPAP